MAADGVHVVVLSNDLGKIAAGMEAKAGRIVRKAALDIQGNAQVRAPVDTGNLRASIIAREVGPTHWQVRVGAEYGIYVEMGTRHMAAQPYLTPAAEFVRAGFLRAMRTVVEP
jgi:HK97 gp10 family phage protein